MHLEVHDSPSITRSLQLAGLWPAGIFFVYFSTSSLISLEVRRQKVKPPSYCRISFHTPT